MKKHTHEKNYILRLTVDRPYLVPLPRQLKGERIFGQEGNFKMETEGRGTRYWIPINIQCPKQDRGRGETCRVRVSELSEIGP